MTVKEVEISQIIPYENNPRKNEKAVEAVAKSIQEFGFKVPVILDSENVIVAGHTRVSAAEKLGLDKIPVIYADDLTDEQIKAFRLADNKTAELSAWDYQRLEQEIDNIINIDMTEFGFYAEKQFIDDDFFKTEEKETKEKDPNRFRCPCCGEWFEG